MLLPVSSELNLPMPQILCLSGVIPMIFSLLRGYSPLADNPRQDLIVLLIHKIIFISVRLFYWVHLFVEGTIIGFNYSILAGVCATALNLIFTTVGVYLSRGAYYQLKLAYERMQKSSDDSKELQEVQVPEIALEG
jgi:hypothetical protein